MTFHSCFEALDLSRQIRIEIPLMGEVRMPPDLPSRPSFFQKTSSKKAPNDGLSCPQGPLNFSQMTSGKNDLEQKPRATGCHARRGL